MAQALNETIVKIVIKRLTMNMLRRTEKSLISMSKFDIENTIEIEFEILIIKNYMASQRMIMKHFLKAKTIFALFAKKIKKASPKDLTWIIVTKRTKFVDYFVLDAIEVLAS